eukprot:scaffold99058_cov16-Tisochrysis_lutea.AAC.1
MLALGCAMPCLCASSRQRPAHAQFSSLLRCVTPEMTMNEKVIALAMVAILADAVLMQEQHLFLHQKRGSDMLGSMRECDVTHCPRFQGASVPSIQGFQGLQGGVGLPPENLAARFRKALISKSVPSVHACFAYLMALLDEMRLDTAVLLLCLKLQPAKCFFPMSLLLISPQRK